MCCAGCEAVAGAIVMHIPSAMADLSKVPCVSSWNTRRAEALKGETAANAPVVAAPHARSA